MINVKDQLTYKLRLYQISHLIVLQQNIVAMIIPIRKNMVCIKGDIYLKENALIQAYLDEYLYIYMYIYIHVYVYIMYIYL